MILWKNKINRKYSDVIVLLKLFDIIVFCILYSINILLYNSVSWNNLQYMILWVENQYFLKI